MQRAIILQKARNGLTPVINRGCLDHFPAGTLVVGNISLHFRFNLAPLWSLVLKLIHRVWRKVIVGVLQGCVFAIIAIDKVSAVQRRNPFEINAFVFNHICH